MPEITREMLRDYLNDSLPDAELVVVEKALRDDSAIQELFRDVRQQVDRGEHSIGAIWRRERLSCASREELGRYLLLALDPEHQDYIEFHLTSIGCPFCQANLDDLKKAQSEAPEPRSVRRRKIVDSAAGVLRDVAGR